MAKIAILTNFQEFNPGYSLTGIVQDQARMLLSYGNEVHVFVNSKYESEVAVLTDDDFHRYILPKDKFFVHKKIPFSNLVDYRARRDISEHHKEIARMTSEMLIQELQGFDAVFTHDFVFTGWLLPYGLGCQMAGRSTKLPGLKWLHWIHSIPTLGFDWWRLQEYGPKNRIVYPNKIDAPLVAAQYFAKKLDDVVVIPHIKDPRSWWEFDRLTCEFLSDHPNLMDADFVQIYPASTDRLSAKRVKEVLLIFSRLKKRGFKVFLVIANQWATGRQRQEDLDSYTRTARRNGLIDSDDFCFTSQWKKELNTGIPRRMLRELLLLSNLFLFPTREESFGLVAPEAALSGVLPVFNKSLQMQMEINGLQGLYFDFGSYHNHFEPENWGDYFNGIAAIIAGRLLHNETIASKTWHRKRYNWDNLYKRHYEPILAEAAMWA